MSISASVQVSLVAEERDRNINRVQELEASITELKNAAGKRFTMLLSSASSSSCLFCSSFLDVKNTSSK